MWDFNICAHGRIIALIHLLAFTVAKTKAGERIFKNVFTFFNNLLFYAQGIVTDVQLAPVLLATVLGRKLCAFDELSQLDPDLYRSLTYVKHYSDTKDVADLSLTFSVDEDALGCLKTVDLVPGGRTIQVTNENKYAVLFSCFFCVFSCFFFQIFITECTAFLESFYIVNVECTFSCTW